MINPKAIAFASVLGVLISSCSPKHFGPSVSVMPAPGKPFDMFLADKALCEQYAEGNLAGGSPRLNNQATTAVLGTLLGAGLGGAIGGGSGAGIGAAAGLAGGAVVGSAAATRSDYSQQGRYDTAYAQCMYSRANQVPGMSDAKQVRTNGDDDTMMGGSQLSQSADPEFSIPMQGYNQLGNAQTVNPSATDYPALPPNSLLASTHSRRIALVIGNGSYLSIGQLKNPTNDAQLIAKVLTGLGYTLIGGVAQIDLDRRHFEQVVQQFGHAISGASVAVFYYAGHGMQVDGTNWLVPVDAELTPRKQDLPFSLLSADNILLQMDGGGARLNLLILDACRNNPLSSRGFRDARGGLAEMHAPASSLIAYSTQPGNVAMDGAGANGPYSLALAAAMQQSDQDIFHVFNTAGLLVQKATAGAQVPWTSTSPISNDARLGDR